jgi:hypothetical protein
MYDGNPLVGGIIAAAVGAALGGSLPITRQEQEKLGSVGEKARDIANQQKDQIASKVGEKKDELLEKADQKLQSSQQQPQQSQQQPSRSPELSGAGAGGGSQSDTPFIIGDRSQ